MANEQTTGDAAPEQNRRGAPRHPFINFAWYHGIPTDDDPSAAAAVQGVAQSCDISRSGVGLLVSGDVPAGQRVFLEVVSNVGDLSAVGQVMYCQPTDDLRYRVGVRLEVIPPTDQKTLARITTP